MKRREFWKTITAAAAGAAFASKPSSRAQTKNKASMYVGATARSAERKDLEFIARHGVYHTDGPAPKEIKGVGWDLDDALAKKEACEKYGIKIDTYHLPKSLTNGNVMLGKSPERDKDIEVLQQMIEVAGKAGIRACLYNTTILPNRRTGITTDPMRGNVSYSTWDYQEALKRGKPMTEAGIVTSDMIFERITYLLDRLMPVAEEWRVSTTV